jgi:hypothetical protein
MHTWLQRVTVMAALLGCAALALIVVVRLEDQPPPSGEQTIVSIDAAKDNVRCGDVVQVFAYVDDLALRPSYSPDAPAGALAGLALVEFVLWYDPAIIELDAQAAVTVNPALTDMDPDADSITRHFSASVSTGNGPGRAHVLARSQTARGSVDRTSLEDGPHPVTQGEPILMLTVNFKTVGVGTTQLDIQHAAGTEADAFLVPVVNDAAAKPYDDVLGKNTKITVISGTCTAGSTPMPTPKPFSPPQQTTANKA